MATITKKKGKWYVQIRRSFHKPIYKMFSAKADAFRWSREVERSIELGQYVDTTEANKTTLRQLLERYGRAVSVKKRSDTEKYQIKLILILGLYPFGKLFSKPTQKQIRSFFFWYEKSFLQYCRMRCT